jgi:hypothetical protein
MYDYVVFKTVMGPISLWEGALMVNGEREDEFYARDRPPNPELPEDRPRGGGRREPLQHRGAWTVAAAIITVFLVIVVGVALFP